MPGNVSFQKFRYNLLSQQAQDRIPEDTSDTIYQKELQEYMPHIMSVHKSDSLPGDMSNIASDTMRERASKFMPNRMPEFMPDRMSKQ